MSIYRGIGGSVDATNDALVEEVNTAALTATTKAAEAATSASQAAISASQAATSATQAAASAVGVEDYATTATTKASEASASELEAESSAANAANSVIEAEGFAVASAVSAAEALQSRNETAQISGLETVEDAVDVAMAEAYTDIIALSLNVAKEAVIYSTDTVTVLDNVLYIYDADAQVTWEVPSDVGAGEVIVSVIGSALVTDAGSYTLTSSLKQRYVVNSVGELKQLSVDPGSLVYFVNGGDIRHYMISTDSAYPRVVLNDGTYASRIYESGTLVMNEDDWNIVTGGWHTPPYTTAEYDIGYWNGKMIQLAMEYADDHNMQVVKTPKGELMAAYSDAQIGNLVGRDATFEAFQSYRYAWITLQEISGVTLDLENTSIKVIFDELNKSPYDTTADPAYKFVGRLINIGYGCSALKITGSLNNPIVGDVDLRTWGAGTPDLNLESTAGIVMEAYVSGVEITNLNIGGFCADSFASSPRPSGIVYYLLNSWIQGGINTSTGLDDDTILTDRRSVLIDVRKSTSTYSGSKTYNDTVQLATTGYTRYPTFYNKNLHVYYYDENSDLIDVQTTVFGDDIVVTGKVKYIRLVAHDDPRIDDPNADYGAVGVYTGFSRNLLLENLVIRNNRRGGIANCPHDTLINKVVVDDMGVGGKNDQPDTNGSTRYYFNQEDVISRNITVRDLKGRGSRVNGILFNAVNGRIENCDIDKSIVLYSAVRELTIKSTTAGSLYFSDSKYVSVGDYLNSNVTEMGIYDIVTDSTSNRYMPTQYALKSSVASPYVLDKVTYTSARNNPSLTQQLFHLLPMFGSLKVEQCNIGRIYASAGYLASNLGELFLSDSVVKRMDAFNNAWTISNTVFTQRDSINDPEKYVQSFFARAAKSLSHVTIDKRKGNGTSAFYTTSDISTAINIPSTGNKLYLGSGDVGVAFSLYPTMHSTFITGWTVEDDYEYEYTAAEITLAKPSSLTSVEPVMYISNCVFGTGINWVAGAISGILQSQTVEIADSRMSLVAGRYRNAVVRFLPTSGLTDTTVQKIVFNISDSTIRVNLNSFILSTVYALAPNTTVEVNMYNCKLIAEHGVNNPNLNVTSGLSASNLSVNLVGCTVRGVNIVDTYGNLTIS